MSRPVRGDSADAVGRGLMHRISPIPRTAWHEDCCDPHSWARRSLGVQKARVVGHDMAGAYGRAVPRGSGETGCDGRISPPAWVSGSGYNNPGFWQFPFQRADPRGFSARTRAPVLRALLNKFRRHKTRSLSEADRNSLHCRVRPPGTHRAAGPTRFIPESREGFCPTLQTKYHAGPGDRRREGPGRSPLGNR